MNQNFDVVTIGNAMIDAFLFLHDASKHCHINEKGEICFVSGEKIPLDQSSFLLGGDACNVAVGLSRAGFKAGLLAEIGNDPFAKTIESTLEKEEVGTSLLLHSDAASSFSMGINFQGERTLFTQHVVRKHAFDFSSLETTMIYLTSLGLEWKGVYENVYSYAQEKKIKLAFNPGTRQLEEPMFLHKLLSVTDVLFLNKEEAERLVGKAVDIKTLLKALRTLGIKIVVITDGKNGSYVSSEEKALHIGALTSFPIVERTGAGDGFATGFLIATIKGKDVNTAMQYGTMNAASVIGKVGAQAGLLTSQEFDQKIKEHGSELVVKII